MTTLCSLSTKDALVMGCDSLATSTHQLVDPFELANYFDHENDWKIRTNDKGQPLLDDFWKIFGKSKEIPFNHMTHVDKLYSLHPLEMGVMITGITSIGNYTIKNLINQFKHSDNAFKFKPANYTVKSIANRLLKFIYKFYEEEFKDKYTKPKLELMIGGYDKREHIPKILRIYVDANKVEQPLENFGIAFGGQMLEIQRIVFGTDSLNRIRIHERSKILLEGYHTEICDLLSEKGIDVAFPKPDGYLNFFSNTWDLLGFDANFEDFSEKNAIECVNFFIDIMIKSQQFSTRMPMVGGEIKIAKITKSEGFQIVNNID